MHCCLEYAEMLQYVRVETGLRCHQADSSQAGEWGRQSLGRGPLWSDEAGPFPYSLLGRVPAKGSGQ